jgi:hypothetical protein
MMIISAFQTPAETDIPWVPDRVAGAGPLQVQAPRVFGAELAAGSVPSVARSAHGSMSGSLAQRARAYLVYL